MTQLTGTPGADTDIADLSVVPDSQEAGIACIPIKSRRGELGKVYKISNWLQYKRNLGGMLDDSDDPLVVKMALDAGAVLYLGRLFHFSDIDDPATISGTAALAEIDGEIEFGGDGGTSSVVTIIPSISGADNLVDIIMVGTGPDQTATLRNVDKTAIASADITALNAALTAAGSWLTVNAITGTIPVGEITLTGIGTTGTISGDTEFEALSVGDGYDGTTINIVAASSKIAGNVDFKITLNESDQEIIIKDIDSNVVTQAAIDKINQLLIGSDAGVKLSSATTSIQAGLYVLAGGVQDLSEFVDADFIGSQISKSGFHIFDDVTDSMRIYNISRPVPEVDIALSEYCGARKDMRFVVRTAIGLGVTGVGEYRNGQGTVYPHSPIDSFYGTMWYSDCQITDPEDSRIKTKEVTALAFKIASRCLKDKKSGEWYSDSGEKSGIGSFSKINKVLINFLSPAYKSSYDSLYEDGLNAIVNHPSLAHVPWGNRSLLRDGTSLLQKDNIADLTVYISNNLKRIASKMSFEPNDIQMFKELYRRVLPFIIFLVENRAIEGDKTNPIASEGTWWHWLGDQNANDLSDLKFNSASDVDTGKYRARFAFKPIASNEYILIDVSPADSATILNVEIVSSI